ncbi:sugar phosphate nucleotidyltransferase, partial [Micromonospora sp. NPDC048839]
MRAVIAVAGTGSRFFPIGKTINKCMLPILNQPVVAYAVADCIAAGAREIAIVTAPGEIGRQVRHYFTEDHDLKGYFTARGWQDKLGYAGQYGALKAGCERAVVSVIGTEQSTVLRPGVILGPREYVGRLTWWLGRAARGGRLLV